jgi:hypothetical protein
MAESKTVKMSQVYMICIMVIRLLHLRYCNCLHLHAWPRNPVTRDACLLFLIQLSHNEYMQAATTWRHAHIFSEMRCEKELKIHEITF